MTFPETAIEPSARFESESGLSSAEASLTPADDPRRPALYHNPDPAPSKGQSAHDLLADSLMGLDGKLMRKLPVQRNFLLRRVMRDLEDRRDVGQLRYGTLLQVDNGRDHLIDAYQEQLDGAVYLYNACAASPADRELRGLYESQMVLLLSTRRYLAVRNGELEPDDSGTSAEAD